MFAPDYDLVVRRAKNGYSSQVVANRILIALPGAQRCLSCGSGLGIICL